MIHYEVAISFLFSNFSVTMSFNLSAIRLLLTFLQSRDLVWFGFKTSPSNRLALSFKICILGPVRKQHDILNSLSLQDQCESCTGCLQTCSKATGSVSVHEQCTNTCTRRTVIPQSGLHFILSARPQHANNWESYPLDRVSAARQEVPVIHSDCSHACEETVARRRASI